MRADDSRPCNRSPSCGVCRALCWMGAWGLEKNFAPFAGGLLVGDFSHQPSVTACRPRAAIIGHHSNPTTDIDGHDPPRPVRLETSCQRYAIKQSEAALRLNARQLCQCKMRKTVGRKRRAFAPSSAATGEMVPRLRLPWKSGRRMTLQRCSSSALRFRVACERREHFNSRPTTHRVGSPSQIC